MDAADYVVWRESAGSSTDLRADGNGDLIIDDTGLRRMAIALRGDVCDRHRFGRSSRASNAYAAADRNGICPHHSSPLADLSRVDRGYGAEAVCSTAVKADFGLSCRSKRSG